MSSFSFPEMCIYFGADSFGILYRMRYQLKHDLAHETINTFTFILDQNIKHIQLK